MNESLERQASLAASGAEWSAVRRSSAAIKGPEKQKTRRFSSAGFEKSLEAQAGIEPTYTDLQCFNAV